MDKKVILITGASTGIGRACADLLHETGWHVVGTSRHEPTEVAWQHLRMDVDDDASVTRGVASILEEHGRLDAVAHCAGWGLAGAVEQTPIADAMAQFETNFWGTVRVNKEVLSIFRGQGAGRIVLMSSIGGLIALPFQSFYSASKFALEGYAESLAYEVAPYGVKVTLVEPGNFKTGFTASRRMVPVPSSDPYEAARDKAIKLIERDEQHGDDPRGVAKIVETVLTSPKPPRRVSVGKFDERIGLVAKRLLPFRIFERAARGSLGV
jgi:NAD(P)-dependent dehydrogenase (short-subunit alcohol dehydrogenase family)